ncbi:uncharacterized protein [Diadema antillarum]|uniref:uncharacterized protein n=1 Tax=Diadema antillarum TaxID=105358 RepID=UPI003A874C67
MNRVLINYCSFNELVALPGISPPQAAHLLELRGQQGSLTQDSFLATSELEQPEEYLGILDFRPYVSEVPETPSPIARSGSGAANYCATPTSHVLPQAVPASSTPAGVSTGVGKGEHPYPYDQYPPPRSDAHTDRGRGNSRRGHQRGAIPRRPLPNQGGVSGRWSLPNQEDVEERRYTSPAPPTSSWRDLGNLSLSGWNTSQDGYKRLSLPKSISFDGKGDWQAFYIKFTAFADESGWSPMQRRNQMWWSLKGQGSDYYTALLDRNPGASYEELVSRMGRRFGATDPPEVVQMEFSRASQSEEETVLDWSDRVISLATKAFPGVPEPLVQRQAVLRFCQGCREREAGLFALNLKPSTVEAAVELVTWLVHSRHAVLEQHPHGSRSRKEVRSTTIGWESFPPAEVDVCRVDFRPKPPYRRPDPSRNAGTVRHDRPEGHPPAVEQRVQSLEQKMVSLQDSVDQLSTNLAKLLPQKQAPQSAADSHHNPCYHCGKPGHFKRECPELGKTVALLGEEPLNDSGPEEEATPWPETELATYRQSRRE